MNSVGVPVRILEEKKKSDVVCKMFGVFPFI
jgi:hypothetical protein